MTPAGFPHSDILGSRLSRQLPEAYRSLTRPSSAPGAKASTVSPCSLDYLDARARYRVLKVLEGRTLKAEQRVSRPTIDLELPTPIERSASGLPRLLRKEVIQPHLPVRLPCYDFTPIASPTFDGSLHEGWATGFGCCPLSWCDGRCVQGPGTYSPRRC
jgi:hypothetical protein